MGFYKKFKNLNFFVRFKVGGFIWSKGIDQLKFLIKMSDPILKPVLLHG